MLNDRQIKCFIKNTTYGAIRMTNQEWLQSLNTEELAKELQEPFGFDIYNCKDCHYYNEDYATSYNNDECEECILCWLKQEHKEEENND